MQWAHTRTYTERYRHRPRSGVLLAHMGVEARWKREASTVLLSVHLRSASLVLGLFRVLLCSPTGTTHTHIRRLVAPTQHRLATSPARRIKYSLSHSSFPLLLRVVVGGDYALVRTTGRRKRRLVKIPPTRSEGEGRGKQKQEADTNANDDGRLMEGKEMGWKGEEATSRIYRERVQRLHHTHARIRTKQTRKAHHEHERPHADITYTPLIQ